MRGIHINNIKDIKNHMNECNLISALEIELELQKLQTLIDYCTKNNLPQPEISPWSDGTGIQAEWDFQGGWYIEIDITRTEIRGLFLKDRHNKGYDDSVSCTFASINDASRLVKISLEHLVSQ